MNCGMNCEDDCNGDDGDDENHQGYLCLRLNRIFILDNSVKFINKFIK